jgi:DNA-binding response OmpR family regulator
MKSAAHNQKLPVLVIEDEPAVMAFICAALKRHGYAVSQARSGREGLDLLAGNRYVGIVSDMRTPGGVSGSDVHRWVLANRPELSNRILFTTGDTANDETAGILKATGVPYIEKPFRVQKLIGMVESVIGRAAE